MTFQVAHDEGLFYRQTLFDQAKIVVLKVGSAVLTTAAGLNLDAVESLCRQICFLRRTGRKVILVSSGAVAAGRQRLGVVKQPGEPLKVKQALAAIGQGLLMQAYEQRFAEHEQQVAQILLTHADLSQRARYLNIRNTILTLFEFGAVPIINENDTVSVQELRFGDNDTLGALITNMIGADMYIMLSDVDGLYTANPALDSAARPVYTVAKIDSQIEGMASNSGSALGTGGMQSKIRAAKMVAACGGSSFIGPGRKPNVLQELFSGDLLGTFFFQIKCERSAAESTGLAMCSGPQAFLIWMKEPAGRFWSAARACCLPALSGSRAASKSARLCSAAARMARPWPLVWSITTPPTLTGSKAARPATLPASSASATATKSFIGTTWFCWTRTSHEQNNCCLRH